MSWHTLSKTLPILNLGLLTFDGSGQGYFDKHQRVGKESKRNADAILDTKFDFGRQ